MHRAPAPRSADLRGTWGTLLLPLRADDTINWDEAAHALDVLVAAGLDGIYAHGTAGEFHTLSEDEYDRINELVADKCARHRIPFQIGASHMSAQTCLGRVHRARAAAPSAVQVTLPDWLPLSRTEVIRFLVRIASAADPVPLVLYNPPHAKTHVAAVSYAAIRREVPSLIGIKVAGGDAAWYAAMREYAGDLAIFVPGHALATGLRHGAAGSYSNVAALNPAGAVGWQRMMIEDLGGALDVERRIQRFLADHVDPLARQGFGNPALDKFLAHLGNWAGIGTRVRWPYASVDESAAERLRPIVRGCLPELFPGQ
ncbi:dihydrodipicolinate synthase family protein [Micromonospora sp. NPDC007230]|uniref:dihydrodipicolinate synthase family protein n=1 Tax=Micromonospora sp. NPDC007230 TaxID=3364237 RepID=UPI003684BDCC